MKTVTVEVRAEREGRLWVLHIADGGVTQARSLGEIEAMVADYVSLTRDVPAERVRVILTQVDPGGGLGDEIAAARRAQADAALAQEDSAARVRKMARDLRDRGLTGVEIAAVLGVSKQRVSQLTAAPATGAAARRSNTAAIAPGGRVRAAPAVPTSRSKQR